MYENKNKQTPPQKKKKFIPFTTSSEFEKTLHGKIEESV
jgi:hypothetical protein